MKESSQTMLAIETAMGTCAVALCHCQGTQVVPLAQRISTPDQSPTVVLFPFIEEVLREGQLSFQDIQAVAVSRGPGS